MCTIQSQKKHDSALLRCVEKEQLSQPNQWNEYLFIQPGKQNTDSTARVNSLNIPQLALLSAN